MEPQKVEALKKFVELVEDQPEILDLPSLKFFKDFLLKWGATIPEPKEEEEEAAPKAESPKAASPKAPPKAAKEEKKEEEIPEPVIEELLELPKFDEDDAEALEMEAEEPPAGSPEGKELSDADFDKQMAIKQEAVDALEDGDLKKALAKYNDVIAMGGDAVSALLYVRRAETLLKLKRPNGCIADCTRALELNPDSGKAYKIRGKAYRRVRDWAKSHADLAMGQKIDFDDATEEIQAYVDERYKKIAEVQRENERREERNERERKVYAAKKRRAAAQAEYERKQKEEANAPDFSQFMGGKGGMPDMSGMGGMGGMPGYPGKGGGKGMSGMDPGMMAAMMSDPDIQAAMSDPSMMGVMQDIMSNPAKLAKYKDNPKVQKLIEKLSGKMGGGMPGNFGAGPGAEDMD